MKKFFIISIFILNSLLYAQTSSTQNLSELNKDCKNLNASAGSSLNKPGCVFCEIITGKKDQEKIIAQNDLAMAIQKNIPAHSPVDFLIIPKKYIVNLKSMDFNKEEDQKILIDMFKLLQELWQQGSKIDNNSGDFSLQINNGACSSQNVFHLHMHVQSPDKTWWK